jgi:hypothetical protein
MLKVKALTHDYGGICDDGFAIEEADVICRQLGKVAFGMVK